MKAEFWMKKAFEQAKKARPVCLPNPAVGAVLVKNGQMIGKGFTQAPGSSHAEMMALQQAGKKAAGSELYVTLEPCSHFGRTPPCTRSLIQAGIKKAFIAMTDPNPQVSGNGKRKLKKAGIEVISGVLGEIAEDYYSGYVCGMTQNRPRIIVKIAQSLDGKINASPGRRTAISGADALKYGHQLRTICDAVLIGSGTLKSDNPNLLARKVRGPQPKSIVIAGTSPLPKNAQIFATKRPAQTIVLSGVKHDLPDWILQPVSSSKKQLLHASAIVRHLNKLDLQSVLVEGGNEIWKLFLEADLWDELHVITSPVLLPKGQFAFDQVIKWGKNAHFHNFAKLGRDVVWVFKNNKKMKA